MDGDLDLGCSRLNWLEILTNLVLIFKNLTV